MITLIPVAMIVPTAKCIYTPSRINKPKQITEQEFMNKYADNARAIPVSFEQDGRSNPQMVTGYGYLLDCWYIIGG